MASYKALLCDLDGTLADSEPLHCAAWLDLLRDRFSINYDEHWFEQFIGTSDVVVSKLLVKEHDLGVTAQEIVEMKRAAFHDAVRREGRSFPGVPELLKEISAAYPLAIATNSGREDADVMIAKLNFDEIAHATVTASDVENMKPAPDIYLLAAKKLGVPADQCIAIEDSGPGGDSAKAAGCFLIGLTDRVTNADVDVRDNAEALRMALRMLRSEA